VAKTDIASWRNRLFFRGPERFGDSGTGWQKHHEERPSPGARSLAQAFRTTSENAQKGEA
jgi:hypothetical protein